MSDVAIKVEGLSKLYKIGRLQRHDTLRDRIADSRVFKLFKRRNGNSHDSSLITHHSTASDSRLQTPDSATLWALKDVSFEVKRGEVVGIIGRNGAGKSTLLKILSRITEPTEGYADINGRVASLLEVGTGFHPELTGRENIYLNGSILGMKRAEIRKKFDEIVAFAEIEKFMDTPVKYYSSGMYVRLAFAVAAHLDPEILLVDEVLAVGDAAFQKKCLGKMDDVAKEGRTILFVSHNMVAIQALCPSSLWLNHGTITSLGRTREIVQNYVSKTQGACVPKGSAVFDETTARKGNGIARFKSASVLDPDGNPTGELPMGVPIKLQMEICCYGRIQNPDFGIGIENYLGQRIVSVQASEILGGAPEMKSGGVVTLNITQANLLPGVYSITLGLAVDYREDADWIPQALEFEVIPYPVYATARIPNPDSGFVFAYCDRQCNYS